MPAFWEFIFSTAQQVHHPAASILGYLMDGDDNQTHNGARSPSVLKHIAPNDSAAITPRTGAVVGKHFLSGR